MSQDADELSGDLVARWREGDHRAAEELFRRYTGRLIALARSRLPAKLARRVDAEDIVQSVYRSFFAGATTGRYDLRRGGDLWRLLLTITLHKLYHQVERNVAGKRAIARERSCGDAESLGGVPARVLAREPSPVEAAALADELEQFMRQLEPLDRRVLEMRLQGYNVEEIAREARLGLRTAYRFLEGLKTRLEEWNAENAGS